jgi:uncharacterized membrane protein YeaQ/YmgE (transglycosylase-associated protein family)
MKLNLIQFIALCFVFGWVAGQVTMLPYHTSLLLGILGAVIAAYLNDAHGKAYKSIKAILFKP